jgi:hypothetical protein
LIIVLASVIVLALVILSPFALAVLANEDGVDWNSLSTVGQTYGAISAVIAVVALGGVAGSLVVQQREAKSNREQSLRVLHTDLLKMAMDNPEYMECWGPFRADNDPTHLRQVMYTNMIISHWEMMYELGALTEGHLRELAAAMFRGDPGRRFWADSRERRIRTAHGRREVRFQLILDDTYRQVLEESDPPR